MQYISGTKMNETGKALQQQHILAAIFLYNSFPLKATILLTIFMILADLIKCEILVKSVRLSKLYFTTQLLL